MLLTKLTAFGTENYTLENDEDEKDNISGISKVMTFLSEISLLLAMIAFLQGMNQSSSSEVDQTNQSSNQTLTAQFSKVVPHRMTLSVSKNAGQMSVQASYFDGKNPSELQISSRQSLGAFLRKFQTRQSVIIKIESQEALPLLKDILTVVKSENQKQNREIPISVGLPD